MMALHGVTTSLPELTDNFSLSSVCDFSDSEFIDLYYICLPWHRGISWYSGIVETCANCTLTLTVAEIPVTIKVGVLIFK